MLASAAQNLLLFHLSVIIIVVVVAQSKQFACKHFRQACTYTWRKPNSSCQTTTEARSVLGCCYECQKRRELLPSLIRMTSCIMYISCRIHTHKHQTNCSIALTFLFCCPLSFTCRTSMAWRVRSVCQIFTLPDR